MDTFLFFICSTRHFLESKRHMVERVFMRQEELRRDVNGEPDLVLPNIHPFDEFESDHSDVSSESDED